MTKLNIVRRLKTLFTDSFLRSKQGKTIVTLVLVFIFLYVCTLTPAEVLVDPSQDGFEVNNWGPNVNLILNKTRYIDVKEDKLKKILMWNDAYGVRTYDIGLGREPFYKYMFPDTR